MSASSRGTLVGRTVSHYRVVAQLGAGGMGVVYRGEDVRLGRPVAIKVVADDFANDPQTVARLRAEARAASALNHPNICTIYDIGTDEGRPFIVMELMEGQTLRERLGRGPLKTHDLVDVGIEIAGALQAAHTAGIVHRDIKPANIFITTGGNVKLLDFGLAKLVAAQRTADSVTLGTGDATLPGTTFGTVAYMSPEQAGGDELDGRTDLFSLGVVLYECATGQRPFEGKTHALILSEILNRPPTPPSRLNQDLPARLQDVIMACLEKDRELRYQSAADLRADLKRVRRDIESGRIHTGTTTGIPAEPSAVTHATTTGNVPPSGTASGSDGTGSTRSWVPLAAGAVFVVAAAAAGAIYVLTPEQPSVTQTSSAPPQLSTAPPAAAAPSAPSAAPTPSAPTASEPAALEAPREAAARAPRGSTPDPGVQPARAAGNPAVPPRVVSPPAPAAARATESTQTAPASPPETNAAGQAAAPSAAPVPAAVAAEPPLSAPAAPSAAAPTSPAGSSAVPPPANPAVSTAAAAPPAAGTAPARPAESAALDDGAAVREVVAAYARAIENKDLALFRSVKPNLSQEEERRLEEGFRTVTSQRVQMTPTSVTIRERDASIVVQRRDVIEAGGRRQTVDSRQTFSLARTPSGWVITDIR